MKIFLISTVCALILTIVLGKICIPILSKVKAGQTILHYVKEHKEKNGTPTMGGLFFITASILIFLLFGGYVGRMAILSMSITLAFMLVGFLDDFIKIKYRKNEGLKPYQKIIFQTAISIVAGVFCYQNNITLFYLPFSKSVVELGWITIPIVAVFFIAITNSVNLIDGLDGLASNVSLIYFIGLFALISVQMINFEHLYTNSAEYNSLLILIACFIGGILGFLVFNTNKAKVFMGDTGSLGIGGLIGAVSIFSLNTFYIPILGIMFVITSISVIIQVAYFKKTKKRVFIMSPLHHHFQALGYSEAKISYCYALITLIVGIMSVVSIL